MQDTFYITEEILLRTHTSPVQARAMDAHDFSKGPLKMISPGRVFRRDTDDATHSHQFHQIEGLVVGKNISMADLQGTLQLIVQKMFGEERQIRLRPSYFPSQSHLLRWMFLASSVVEKAVMYVRKQVGSRLWVPVWFTHVSLNEWYRCDSLLWDLPLVLVKSV